LPDEERASRYGLSLSRGVSPCLTVLDTRTAIGGLAELIPVKVVRPTVGRDRRSGHERHFGRRSSRVVARKLASLSVDGVLATAATLLVTGVTLDARPLLTSAPIVGGDVRSVHTVCSVRDVRGILQTDRRQGHRDAVGERVA
jgi:hypothetical protein